MSYARRINALLRLRVGELAQHLFPNGHREGNHWCVGDISGAPGKSFKVCLSGDKAGLWGDFANGKKHSNGLLDLWMAARNVDFATALREAADWLGYSLNGQSAPEPTKRSESNTIFDWQACVSAFTDKHLERLAKWRGYSIELCSWLKNEGLIGLHEGCIAFPVDDEAGRVVAAHYRLRGILADLIPASSTAYMWTQNDAPGEKWQQAICANTKATIKCARIPEHFKDLNDWTRSGAASDDLLAAMINAEVVRALEGFAGSVGGQELENKNKEPFPLASLPPLVEAMAKEVCAAERVPESLVGCCALGILSASIGAGLQVQSATNRFTRGNLYVLATAESGSGKSETFRQMAKPFQQFEIERVKTWREQDRADIVTRRTLVEVDIKELKRKYAKESGDITAELKAYELEMEELQKRLHEPILSCEDVTTEKLADLLSKNDEQLASLSSDALSIVNILLGRYNKLDRTDEGLYLKTYSGDACRIDRMSRDPVSLESPCLTALWLTQPDKLQSLLDERSLNEGGLIPRILACHTDCEPREIGKNPPSISSSVEKAYAGLIYSLLTTYRLAPERFTIEPTSEALEALNDHHDAIVKRRRGELRDVTSYAARWNEHAWRITVCLHAGTHGSQAHEQPVALETAHRAIALADWFAEEQLRILNAGRMERKAARLKKLKELLIQRYNGTATLRDLDKSNNFKQDEVRELASRFPDILMIEKRVTSGRPSEIVSITKK
jgi:hypothetical protein